MGVSIDSKFNENYTLTKNQIKNSDKKTGILEIKSASKTNSEEPIKLQLTYMGHRDKMISSVPLHERTSTDSSTQSPSIPVGLRFKSRKDLEKMMAHPNLLNSTLNHIASLNLQAPTPLENLSLQQLKDVDALIRICHDRHTPKLLKNAISEQILSNVKPQALLKNPQLLHKTIKTISALLDPQKPTESQKLSPEEQKTVNVKTSPNTQEPIKPQNLSSEKLQDLTALLNTYNDSKTPQAVKQAISNQVLSKIEPKELIENPKLLQENLQLMSSLNLQTFVRGNLNALQKDLANADTDSLAKHLKELNKPEAKQNFKTLDQLIGAVKDPKMPQAQKDLIQSFFQHPKKGITRQERKEFEQLSKDLPILLKRYPEQLKQTLELQKTVRNANKVFEDINKGGKELQINMPKLIALAEKAPIPPSKTNHKDLKTDEGKMALQKYEEECKKYETAIQALSDDEKTLWKANKAMGELSQIAFDKKRPTELRDLVKQDFFRFCREENAYTMKSAFGIPDSIISTLTTRGGPVVQDKLNEEELRREAINCGVKTESYALQEYNGHYIILKNGENKVTAVRQYQNTITLQQGTIKIVKEDIKKNPSLDQEKGPYLKSLYAEVNESKRKLKDLLSNEKQFNTQEEALQEIAQKHKENQDISPTSGEGNFRFYEIHAEKVPKDSPYRLDQLLYYNVIDDITTLPINELRVDTIGILIERYSQQLNTTTEPEPRQELAAKIEELVKEAQKRLPTMQRFTATQFIFNGFYDKEKQLRAHTLGLTQNGSKAILWGRDIPKMVAKGNAALKQYKKSLQSSQEGLNTSATQNSTETVTA